MKTIRTGAIWLIAIFLVGCGSHLHGLIKEESSREITTGWFEHDASGGPAMMLEFRGQRFERRGFAISKTQNLAQLRRRFPGAHYKRIFSGLDTDHLVYSANPELRALDGTSMQCSVAWRRVVAPAGQCVTADGEDIYVRFE